MVSANGESAIRTPALDRVIDYEAGWKSQYIRLAEQTIRPYIIPGANRHRMGVICRAQASAMIYGTAHFLLLSPQYWPVL